MLTSPLIYLLIFLVTSVAGCSDTHPPKGFEAVQPQHLDTSRQGCPDLLGSYQLSEASGQTELIAEWLNYQNPAMTALIIDQWVGSNAFNYHVQMEYQAFMAQARRLRDADPAAYYDWRKRTLDILKNTSEFPNPEQIVALQQIGPVLRLKGQGRGYECDQGWMKILEKERLVPGDDGQYTRQWDLWVARDNAGDLLVQTVISRQQPGWTFWAAGGAGVRLITENREWGKIPKLNQDVKALTMREEDLPPVSPPNNSPDCHRDVNHLVQYNQQLMQTLPAEVKLTKFLPTQGAPTDACNHLRLQVGFAGSSAGAVEKVLRQIREDPRVENFDVTEMRMDSNKQWHFSLEYAVKLE